jgi:hydroxymethylbilane synthase
LNFELPSPRRYNDGMENALRIRLGTRSSNLALTQSRYIARRLERAHPGLTVELVEISTTGDQVRGKPLASFGGAGVFVKELEQALLEKRVDLAVHSLKDLPTAQPKGLTLGAIVGREDPRDVAVLRGAARLAELPAGAVIGSGSTRRRAQLKVAYPHLEFAEIRGNVETRMRKVADGQYAGTILARAGLKRLGLVAQASSLPSRWMQAGGLRYETLSHDLMLPAPGQGALAIECRAKDARVRKLLSALHNPLVAACVEAERSALEALGGGCHLPFGALGTVAGRKLLLRGVVCAPDGAAIVRAEAAGRIAKARELGRKVAREILAHGGRKILAQA